MPIQVPDGTTVEVGEGTVKVTGKLGSIEKKFNKNFVKAELKDGAFVAIPLRKETKKIKALVNSLEAHVKKMIAGVNNGFEKKLTCVFAHFPISVEVKGKHVLIKNFLGERVPRVAEIVGNTSVDVKGADIFVKGINKEDVGQTVKNIVSATKIKERDIRIFQDGIYVVE